MQETADQSERLSGFRDFTRPHGFEVKDCRPYRPSTNGPDSPQAGTNADAGCQEFDVARQKEQRLSRGECAPTNDKGEFVDDRGHLDVSRRGGCSGILDFAGRGIADRRAGERDGEEVNAPFARLGATTMRRLTAFRCRYPPLIHELGATSTVA